MLQHSFVCLSVVITILVNSVAHAEQDFERRPTFVEKQYSSGELISLRCGEELISCELTVKTKLNEVNLVVPFAAHGYVPNLKQIMMYVRDDAEASVTVRTDVECADTQMEWADRVGAFRLSCVLILNIDNGIIKDWFSEAIPSLQPKAGLRK